MASMDDLIATLSGVQAGPHGNDLQDLHAKLKQTIPTTQYYRPIPPTSASSSTIPPHSSTSGGPLPPPAPASSWNTPTVLTGRDNFGFGASPSRPNGLGTSPLRQGGWNGMTQGNGQAGGGGTSIPGPKVINTNGGGDGSGRRLRSQGLQEEEGMERERPYHANVLPVKASPKDTGGFEQDAFRPLWASSAGTQGQGMKGGNVPTTADWGGFTGERL